MISTEFITAFVKLGFKGDRLFRYFLSLVIPRNCLVWALSFLVANYSYRIWFEPGQSKN